MPAFIAIEAFVHVRRINERIDNVADEVDELWDRLREKGAKSS